MGITSLISYIVLEFVCAQVKLVVWTGLLLLSLVNLQASMFNLCGKQRRVRVTSLGGPPNLFASTLTQRCSLHHELAPFFDVD
jgi:hypothetical protein